MKGIYRVEDIRTAEATLMATLPAGALMQRAAHALAIECAALLPKVYGARVVLLVGGGNNGGDALFAGAELAARGARVTALLLDAEHAHADGLLALDRAGGRPAGADAATVAGADLVVDGIVGIGGRGGLRGAAIELAAAARDVLTVAVDVPSGVDADTGWAGDDVIAADVTVTFGALKAGLVVGPGAELVGEVRLVDIGLAPLLPDAATNLLEASDVRGLLPRPNARDDKYTRGVVGVAAGSVQYAGAGVLATGSAVHGGAGMVRYVGLAPDEIRARYPEVVVHPDARPHDVRVQAWVVGPGLGTDDTAMSLLSDVLRTDVPVIIDADAITLVARSPGLVRGRSAPTVLTPHDREFARIAGEPSADRLASVRRAARDLGATVLLKGNATVIADPEGAAYVNPTGTPWLATAGSGDVLSGLLGSLLAAGLPPPLAAASAAYIHGVAGQLAAAAGPISATDVLGQLRAAFRAIAGG
jgi:ADP-dependent NAD(P)H-hydrate dehydratase / NAD(P)H-hydrate epimerase